MQEVFKGTEAYIACYFDDILVFSPNLESHLQDLDNALQKLATAGLRINMKKCDFVKPQVDFLGHEISANGVRPLQSKLTEIVQVTKPINADQKHFILITDASNIGIGFVLAQEDNGELRPVQFGGRTLSPSERRFATTDKELLATFKDVLNRRYRWIEYLQELGELVYLPGKENAVADYLSRNVKAVAPIEALGGFSMYFAPDLFDNDELLAAQRDDTQLQAVIKYLEHHKNEHKLEFPSEFRRKAANLSIDDTGFLVYKHHGKQLMVLPQELRTDIVSLCHSDWAAGHFGVFKTHRRVLSFLVAKCI
eukprot:gene19787-21726_t